MVMVRLYSDFIMYKTWASNSPRVYTKKLVFSGKYLSVMFLEELSEETCYQSNPKEANLCHCKKQTYHHSQDSLLWGFLPPIPFRNPIVITFKLLCRISESLEHLLKVHERMPYIVKT